MQEGQRILYNTLILYIRMFVSIAIGLFSTRVILSSLGATDYGIYSLVAGVVAMLLFLNSSLSSSTQRYISHTIGAGKSNTVKKVFATSIMTHLILGLVVVVLLELFGLHFMESHLSIPIERLSAAIFVFHCMVLTTFFSIITVPFDGLLNANENFLVIAIFEIFLSLGSLATAIYLLYTGYDKLIVYGVFTTIFYIFQLVLKQIYCQIKYSDCNFKFTKYGDVKLFKEMIKFAGWNMFGSFCSIARNQGIAIVLNLFFGVVINAAYGIANQVNNQLVSLSTVIGKAISPQLTKSEGKGDRIRMLQLGMLASKIPFMLMALISVPLILEMPAVLSFWLKNVPDNTVIFTRLFLVLSLLSTLSSGIISALLAIGNIKLYQIVVGGTLLLNVPISWILFKLGFPSFYSVLVAIALEVISHILRLYFLKHLAGSSVKSFIIDVDLKPMSVVLLSIFVGGFIVYLLSPSILRLAFVSLSTICVMLLGWYHISLLKSEKQSVILLVNLLFKKFSFK